MEASYSHRKKLLGRFTQRFFQPFLQPAHLDSDTEIMQELNHVKKSLQVHYINQKAIRILFEYYDSNNALKMTEQNCLILSPILNNAWIKVQSQGETFFLELNQIIRVTAITQANIA